MVWKEARESMLLGVIMKQKSIKSRLDGKRSKCIDVLREYVKLCVDLKPKDLEVCHLARVNNMIAELEAYSLPSYMIQDEKT